MEESRRNDIRTEEFGGSKGQSSQKEGWRVKTERQLQGLGGGTKVKLRRS